VVVTALIYTHNNQNVNIKSVILGSYRSRVILNKPLTSTLTARHIRTPMYAEICTHTVSKKSQNYSK